MCNPFHERSVCNHSLLVALACMAFAVYVVCHGAGVLACRVIIRIPYVGAYVADLSEAFMNACQAPSSSATNSALGFVCIAMTLAAIVMFNVAVALLYYTTKHGVKAAAFQYRRYIALYQDNLDALDPVAVEDQNNAQV